MKEGGFTVSSAYASKSDMESAFPVDAVLRNWQICEAGNYQIFQCKVGACIYQLLIRLYSHTMYTNVNIDGKLRC